MFAHRFGLPARSSRRRPGRLVLPAGLVAVALTVAACGSSGSPSSGPTSSGSGTSPAAGASTSSSPSASPSPAKTVVKVTTLNSDGATYGVGMPVIAFFSRKITDAKAWEDGTSVTVDDKPITADWYFEQTSLKDNFYEAHLRPQTYWPAHAKIHVTFPAAGTSLGGNFVSDGKLTSLDFSTGPRNVSTISSTSHQMVVTSDGKNVGTYPVSLGYPNTPTANGIKVIMEKGRDISMRGPGYYDPSVKFTQRLTYGGEYLHSAPWNTGNIGYRNTSNGCTNLRPADAEKLYDFFRIGDVFSYPDADGPKMRLGDGYGDWNVAWNQWQTGGAVSTTS